ncbi:hypothetical protein CGMCC3_g4312 [Colletotrichum fructicola]|nr:uncharacterized protein CGMCC3_g4312 [Colletotrichum fructicola]KAE9579748.1 hypothetical protein CGMCC3_g4312 [Colletotrichum fructicola]
MITILGIMRIIIALVPLVFALVGFVTTALAVFI